MSDRDLLVAGTAAAAWAGAWLGTSAQVGWISSLVGGLGVGLLLAWLAVPSWRQAGRAPGARFNAVVLIAVLIAGSGGFVAGATRSASDARSPLVGLATQRASVSSHVTVTSDPRPVRDGRGDASNPGVGNGRCSMRVRVEALEIANRVVHVRSPALLFAAQQWCALVPGTRVRAAVTWSTSDRATETAVGSVRAAPVVVAPAGWLQQWAVGIRAGLRDASDDARLTGAALVPALVVGDESALPDEVIDDLRRSGLTHLSAVSGANVAIVLAAVLLLARWCGARSMWLTVIGLVTLFGFVVVARPEPSVLRAAVMGVVVVLAAWRGGGVRAPAALAASVLVLVVVDPWLSRSVGFALSVAATAGLVLVVRRWTTGGAGRFRAAVLTALAAQLAVAPLIAGLNGRLDLGGVVANVLAEPAVAPATVLGFAAAVVAPLSGGAAHVLVVAAGVPAEWIVRVADVIAQQRWATLPWPSGAAPALVLGMLTAGAFAAHALLRRSPVKPGSGATTQLRRRTMSTRSLGVVVVCLSLVAIFGLPVAAKAQWPPPGWLIVMCDVGQGDAVILNAGQGRGILVDTGPDARHIDRCLRDAGVRRLLLVVLTHFHVDHVNGVRGALRDRHVDQILVSPLDEPAAPGRDVRVAAQLAGVPVSIAEAGSGAVVGPWAINVVGPSSLDPGEGSPPNNASVVLRAERHGLSALLLGDAELHAQRDLLRTIPPQALAVDVLKVAHHGSAVQDPALTAAAAPSLALVSAGCRNRYGHPAPETLAQLRGLGAIVARTDTQGDIAVVTRPRGPIIIARGAAPTQGPASQC